MPEMATGRPNAKSRMRSLVGQLFSARRRQARWRGAVEDDDRRDEKVRASAPQGAPPEHPDIFHEADAEAHRHRAAAACGR